MDGFFEILMMVIMIWVISRGAKKKKQQSRLPGADAAERGAAEESAAAEERGAQKQRPEEKTKPQEQRPELRPGHEKPRAEAQRRETRTAERRGWQVQDDTAGQPADAQRERRSDLAEIAGLAEAAARRRAGPSEPPASVRAARRFEAAPPDAEAIGAARPAAVRQSASSGLRKLEGLSELERAIIYAEILGPPKALQSDGEADS
jgi:hypothetical protein